MDKLPTTARNIANVLTSFFGFAIFGLMVWAQIKLGLQFYKVGAETDLIRIPYFPFAFLLGLGALAIFLVAFFQVIHTLGQTLKKE